MGGGSSVQQKHLPVEGLDAQPSMYGALSEYLGDLKGAGLNNTEVYLKSMHLPITTNFFDCRSSML